MCVECVCEWLDVFVDVLMCVCVCECVCWTKVFTNFFTNLSCSFLRAEGPYRESDCNNLSKLYVAKAPTPSLTFGLSFS